MGIRRRRKGNKIIWNLFLITLLFFIIMLTIYFAFADGKYSVSGFVNYVMNNNQNDPFELNAPEGVSVNVMSAYDETAFRIEADLLEQIENYFKLKYAQYGILESPDYSRLYTHTSGDMVFDEAVSEFLTQRRLASGTDLTFTECEVILLIEAAAYGGATIAEIALSESFETTFAGVGKPSVYRGVDHFFVFKKESGRWQVDRHTESSKIYDYMNEVFDSLFLEEGIRRDDVTRTYMERYIKEFKSQLYSNRYKYKADNKTPAAQYVYNRTKAVEYALAWTDKLRALRNTEMYSAYDEDSVNFTSQCLYAGGIPMDYSGDAQWKWYDKQRNRAEKAEGRSDSWIDAGEFYYYITRNKGVGMRAKVVTINQTKPGDIIQFARPLEKGDRVYYQCLITGRAGNELLLTAHDDDIRNFPLSALGFNFTRSIKILGFN